MDRRGPSFVRDKQKKTSENSTFWLKKEEMGIEAGGDFCFSHPTPALPPPCPSQHNYFCLCKIINCKRTFQVLMRSSGTGLGVKAGSCTEALITVMMHQEETILLLTSHSPSCWGGLAVKNNIIYLTVQLVHLLWRSVSQEKKKKKKAEYSVQFVSVSFQSKPHEKFIEVFWSEMFR